MMPGNTLGKCAISPRRPAEELAVVFIREACPMSKYTTAGDAHQPNCRVRKAAQSSRSPKFQSDQRPWPKRSSTWTCLLFQPWSWWPSVEGTHDKADATGLTYWGRLAVYYRIMTPDGPRRPYNNLRFCLWAEGGMVKEIQKPPPLIRIQRRRRGAPADGQPAVPPPLSIL